MSTHKHIDKICCVILAFTLIFTLVFANAGSLGVSIKASALGYESKIFNTSVVHEIDISMDNWDSFIESCADEEYEVCNVTIDGEQFKNVAIRAKGNTSLSSVQAYGNNRYSFKIEFDKFDNANTYYGLDKLCLNNVIQDNTYMKDYLTYELMREIGAASPLCAFVRITVNGELWGLYLAVEGVEESFLERNYGSDYGELYKPDSMSMGGGRGNGIDFDFSEWQQTEGTGEEDADSSQSGSQFPSMPEGGFSFGGEMPEGGFSFGGEMPEGGFSFGGEMPKGGFSFSGEMPEEFSDFSEMSTEGESADISEMFMGGGFPDMSNMPEDGSFPDMGGGNFPDMENMPEGFPDMGDMTEGAFPGMSSGEMPDMGSMFGGFGGFGSNDVSLVYTDDNYSSYENIFSNAKTDVTNSDKDRLISALKNLNENTDITGCVDVEQVIRYFVAHNFTVNFDSYTGMMIHNYYLYEKDGQLTMLPWDYNLAFGGFQSSGDATSLVNYPIDSPVSGGDISSRPMLAWIFESEEYTALYHEYFDEFISQVFESGKFDVMMAQTKQLISPYVEEDPTKFCTYEEFEQGYETLVEFCNLRAESIRGQLNGEIGIDSASQKTNTNMVDAGELRISDMGSMGSMGGFGGGKSDSQSSSFGDIFSGEKVTSGNIARPDREAGNKVTDGDVQRPDRESDFDMNMKPSGTSAFGGTATGIIASVVVLAAGLIFAKGYKRRKA